MDGAVDKRLHPTPVTSDRLMWVELLSYWFSLCFVGFSPGSSGFLPPQQPTVSTQGPTVTDLPSKRTLL